MVKGEILSDMHNFLKSKTQEKCQKKHKQSRKKWGKLFRAPLPQMTPPCPMNTFVDNVCGLNRGCLLPGCFWTQGRSVCWTQGGVEASTVSAFKTQMKHTMKRILGWPFVGNTTMFCVPDIQQNIPDQKRIA